MSNTKAAVEVKQEGEFTLKGKSKPRKPKQLGNKEQEIPKVSIKEPLVEVEPDVKKVEIKNEEIKTKRRCHSNRRNKGGICGKTIRR